MTSSFCCVLKQVHENLAQKSSPIREFSDVKWKSYEEVQQESLDFGLGLIVCGLSPQAAPSGDESSLGFEDVAGQSSICIYENT